MRRPRHIRRLTASCLAFSSALAGAVFDAEPDGSLLPLDADAAELPLPVVVHRAEVGYRLGEPRSWPASRGPIRLTGLPAGDHVLIADPASP